MSQEKKVPESPALPQSRVSSSLGNKKIETDVLKDAFLRRFSITPEGGQVHLKEVGVFLLVPPGALAETTEMFIGISWRKEDMPPLPPCQTRASPVVVCGPHGLTFRKPVYLSFYHCISGTRERKMGKKCPENLSWALGMNNPFYIWQSQTHFNEPCQWKVLSSDSVVLTSTKCIFMMNQFCKHSLSCDNKGLCALLFGSYHASLLKLMVYCVNDIPNEIKNVTKEAEEELQMKRIHAKKKFRFFTCGYSKSSSKEKKSYDVSLSLEGFETKWNMPEDSPQKFMKYSRLCVNNEENITFSLSPKEEGNLEVFVSKIYIKQEGTDQEEDIREITSTEFDIHWVLPVGPAMDNDNLNCRSGGLEGVKLAPQLPGGELQRHGGKHLQTTPNQLINLQGQQIQPRIQPDIGNQQDDYRSQTARKMVVQEQYRQNQPSLQSNFVNQLLQQGNVQSQALPGESAEPNQHFHQEGQPQHSKLPVPQGQVVNHHQEEQGEINYETSRKSVHEFPSSPPQQDHMAAGNSDLGDTDSPAIRTMENPVPYNQLHGGNQLGSLSTTLMQGMLKEIDTNKGNLHITLNVKQVNNIFSSDTESMRYMKEEDVTKSFHKHVPSCVKKQLNETLAKDDVWDQVKKMYNISGETTCPRDVVSFLLSLVKGSIACFINVLLALEREQDIPQDLIDKVKMGLKSEMEYNILRGKVIPFAEELRIDIESILDYLYQYEIMQDEENTKLKRKAKENPQAACRNLIQVLIDAISPNKEPIRHFKDALRQFKHEHLADELEVSYQDVEDELQKNGGEVIKLLVNSHLQMEWKFPLHPTQAVNLLQHIKTKKVCAYIHV